MAEGVLNVVLAVIIATLMAIVYSLKVLILMERRVARMESHIEKITNRILLEELRIERALKIKPAKAKASTKKKSKSTKRKAAKKKTKRRRR